MKPFTEECFSDNKIVDAKHDVSKSFCNQNEFSESIYLYIHTQEPYTRSMSFCVSNQGQYKKHYILTDARTDEH